jgi:hypothetical protein
MSSDRLHEHHEGYFSLHPTTGPEFYGGSEGPNGIADTGVGQR